MHEQTNDVLIQIQRSQNVLFGTVGVFVVFATDNLLCIVGEIRCRYHRHGSRNEIVHQGQFEIIIQQ